MRITTKHFGEVDLEESKIIEFDNGLMGFEDYKKYVLIYDSEEEERPDISWLQSVEEPMLALPVVSPFIITEQYNPEIDDEMFTPLGSLTEDNMIVLVVITVPVEVSEISANLRAPIIINTEEKKGVQVIVQNSDYEVKYRFYDKLKKEKEGLPC